MKREKIERGFGKGILIVVLMLFLISLVSAYSQSSVQYTQYQSANFFGGEASSLEFDDELCQQGQDFVIQIAPFGCDPAVVRTDLLEEQNVPVFCQLAATKINPLIDVEAIESLSFSDKDLPPEVEGIGFLPSQSALNTEERLNTPILDNIGYAVIVLKKQANSSAVSGNVSGSLSARVKYDVKNAFGVGGASFYLPQMTDSEWNENRVAYGFWEGRGFLRAEDVKADSASISIYDGQGDKVRTVSLNNGEKSGELSLPGFACQANLQLRLDDLESPGTRAKLRVNNDLVEAAEEENFLDRKCEVTDIERMGIVQKVTIDCDQDSTARLLSFGDSFDLFINPVLRLEIQDQEREVEVGDYLFSDSSGTNKYYLGYAGTKTGSNKKEDLEIVILGLPSKTSERGDKLNSDDLTYIARLVKGYGLTDEAGSTSLFDAIKELGQFTIGGANNLFNHIIKGEKTEFIDYDDGEETVAGNDIKILGFATPVNQEFESDSQSQEMKKNYEKAMEDYDFIKKNYAGEAAPYTDVKMGEEAIYQQILISSNANQKQTVLELCKEFKDQYPNSEKQLVYCGEDTLASPEVASKIVFVNGKSREITFEGIYEPTFDEFGADILIRGPNGKVHNILLQKNERASLDAFRDADEEASGEFIQLIDLEDGAAQIRISLEDMEAREAARSLLVSDTRTVKLGVPQTFSQGYTFTLSRVNLKKSAKVSVLPNINNVASESNFSFNIGIEQRSIQLSPTKTKNLIEKLNKTIDQWQDRSDKLARVVKGLKGACLGVGAWVTVKNFFGNLGGKGIARQDVMRGSGGWNEICQGLVNDKKYQSLDECYAAKANEIDQTVEAAYKVQKSQQDQIKRDKESHTTGGVFNSSSYMKVAASRTGKELADSSWDKADEMSSLLTYDAWKTERTFTSDDLTDIEYYSKVLDDPSVPEEYKLAAKQRLDNLYKEVSSNSENYQLKKELASKGGVSSTDVQFLEVGENVRKLQYTGKTFSEIKGSGVTGVSGDQPVQVVQTSVGGQYLVVLDGSAGTSQYSIARNSAKKQMIYNYNSGELIEKPSSELSNSYFVKYDKSSYENKYKNPELKYYETEPYKGRPAIVPFDLNNGWYAATRQTLGVGTGIASFDESGRVNSFYLCNVGQNGLAEFKSGIGDDICQMVNSGTGQPYNQFSGLQESEVTKLIQKAVKAIEEASKKYKEGISGQVSILDQIVSVGSPAVDVPEMQCQDIMSPKDCLLMFNVCDPVICPSSRCDLGGAYPVQDVVQSGIIGGLTLCLPNFREGIYIPVCLTGIQAGIDGLVSVFGTYRDCLQESLETGQQVGICDEIYSVYLCEFFWKQALPFAEVAIPKLIGAILGQGSRGGGEYMGVQNAWQTAQDSFGYFTQSYAVNSFKAFQSRSIEDIGTEICKSQISGVYPSLDFFDSFTEPDSPAQFHGRFDEIEFTTLTNPPISQYKVFYHIYAGKDSGGYYSVYLKGAAGSSFYQDTGAARTVAQGYVAAGEYATETKDFTAPSGYKELCIDVNGQEECGFSSVSTDFALDYVKEKYIEEQATETDIQTESECVSGTASAHSLLSLNVEEAASSLVDPQIYNKGIIRICATGNPGQGTDPLYGTENARWQEVGHCGDAQLRCWLDTESIKDIVRNTKTEQGILSELSENTFNIVQNEGNYVLDFESEYEELKKIVEPTDRINEINKVLEKVFFNRHKAQLLFLRAEAYGNLLDVWMRPVFVSVGTLAFESAEGKSFTNDWGTFNFQDQVIYKDIDSSLEIPLHIYREGQVLYVLRDRDEEDYIVFDIKNPQNAYDAAAAHLKPVIKALSEARITSEGELYLRYSFEESELDAMESFSGKWQSSSQGSVSRDYRLSQADLKLLGGTAADCGKCDQLADGGKCTSFRCEALDTYVRQETNNLWKCESSEGRLGIGGTKCNAERLVDVRSGCDGCASGTVGRCVESACTQLGNELEQETNGYWTCQYTATGGIEEGTCKPVEASKAQVEEFVPEDSCKDVCYSSGGQFTGRTVCPEDKCEAEGSNIEEATNGRYTCSYVAGGTLQDDVCTLKKVA